jgi:hypothetical protein
MGSSTGSRGKLGPRHMFIPDTQVKPGVATDHIAWAARYAASKLPDVIIQAGDWYDMPSLSSWDRGKKASHGRTVRDDMQAGDDAIALFERELKKHAPRGYNPRKVITLGNHEDRMHRHVEEFPELDGTIGTDRIAFHRHGWMVVPFLQPITVHGVTYAHFFPLNAQGRVSSSKHGAPSAQAQVKRMMRSSVAGHRQGLDTSVIHTPGRTVRGVIAGSYYQHSEGYLTKMGDTYWRGVLLFNDVRPASGEFDICEVSLQFLERRFG